MPLLRHVLGAASDRSHALLRAKALECISLVGMAVGREQFRQDAHAVMQLMQTLQARNTCPPGSSCATSLLGHTCMLCAHAPCPPPPLLWPLLAPGMHAR
jgi:hypothetical protein